MGFNMVSSTAILWLCLTSLVASQTIQPDFTVSYATQPNVSYVDFSYSEYDRIVLKYDGSPFFFNGVQLRADNLRVTYNLTDQQLGSIFQSASDAGFTVINSQLSWMSVQPDSSFVATDSAYIQSGTLASTNFGGSLTNHISFSSSNASDSSLTYLKFDFSSYTIEEIDAAKVRIYVTANATNDRAFTANLYGITNSSWASSSITWNNAPNHNGVNIAGTKGTDYFLASSSPSWDPILGVSYYDFDASDFIINNCPSKIASFILQPQTNETSFTNGAIIGSVHSATPPTLWISSMQSWDYTYLDNLLSWAQNAGTNLEFLWFGSDSSGATMDLRVPYWVFKNHIKVEKVQTDGTVVPKMVKNVPGPYGVYWYLMDKNDFTLRGLEKAAVKNVMNHIAEWDAANGNKKTLIGVDVCNECNAVSLQEATGGGTTYQNPATWSAFSKFSSQSAFFDRTMWEFKANIANAVKESNYPVWTRSNSNSFQSNVGMPYNEQRRAAGGTSIDFVGLDPYVTDTTLLWKFGHEQVTIGGLNLNWATGENFPMIMENSGAATNSEWLTLATLAGGGVYNMYDFMGEPIFNLYQAANAAAGNFTPVPRGSYVADVVSTNYILRSIQQLIATLKPNGAGGKDLVYFNALNLGTNLTSNVWSMPVTYAPSTGGVGIAGVPSSTAVVFTSTREAAYAISNVQLSNIQSIQHGSYQNGNWISSGNQTYTYSNNKISFNVTQGALVHIKFNNSIKT